MQIVDSPCLIRTMDDQWQLFFLPGVALATVTLVILFNLLLKFNLNMRAEHSRAVNNSARQVLRMSEATKLSSKGSDWTRLLTDPDLVSHLGRLLQTYREVSPEHREAALLRAMREIKDAAVKDRALHENVQERLPETVQYNVTPVAEPEPPAELPHPEPVDETPPFEPDLFVSESDRRRFQRIKCYVAVEIHVEGEAVPVWGNLANVGRGGCLVETASAVPAGKALEIGLWVEFRR